MSTARPLPLVRAMGCFLLLCVLPVPIPSVHPFDARRRCVQRHSKHRFPFVRGARAATASHVVARQLSSCCAQRATRDLAWHRAALCLRPCEQRRNARCGCCCALRTPAAPRSGRCPRRKTRDAEQGASCKPSLESHTQGGQASSRESCKSQDVRLQGRRRQRVGPQVVDPQTVQLQDIPSRTVVAPQAVRSHSQTSTTALATCGPMACRGAAPAAAARHHRPTL